MSADQTAAHLTPLQQAIYLLKQTQAKLAAWERAHVEPIAVIGVGCRFPGSADSPDAFWRLLLEGIDAISPVPDSRWNVDDYYDPDPTVPNKMNTRWGGFVDNVDAFDAEFFGISTREALRVDPQQRLLLEVAWEALEDAGLPAARLAHSRTGVYIGAMGSDYGLMELANPEEMDFFSGTGVSQSIVANRLSYFLNLRGPSMTLDTACSSSLVAVHLACQSLRRRESNLALAGGVNLILSPATSLALTKAQMLAPDGRCKTFDAAANGYVRSEGCGVVVLKRLSDAQSDGDRILSVIRGTAVNHDGRTNGLSAPNGPAQEALIRAALEDASLSPAHIGYVEAHGTGTRLGDPIEIEALRNTLAAQRPADRPLLVGSVKSNIGHLESAAGIAGLIKVVLMLRHGRIPAQQHLKNLNPLLQLEGSLLEIPTAPREWPLGPAPRRAGVSSFGFGGTNAHVIVEEPPAAGQRPQETIARPRHLLTLSARSPAALWEQARRYAASADSAATTSLADFAYTANVGREHFAHRAAVSASSLQELRDQLRGIADRHAAGGSQREGTPEDGPPRVAFLFTGQGAQYAGMGRELYQTQPAFRAVIDECDALLRMHLDRPLLSVLDPQAGALVAQTGYAQPALFAIGYALARLWQSWGVEPAAVMGHSVGELAAACVAGVLSLKDATTLIAQRARLMQSSVAGGLMAAIRASEAQVSDALRTCGEQVAIAALNGPENIVISGAAPAVRRVLRELESQGIAAQALAASHAFHSHLMDGILDELGRVAETVQHSPPRTAIVSNLTGQIADEHTYSDPTYWSRHTRLPVRFGDGMQTLAGIGCDAFIEMGPKPVLIGMGRRCLCERAHLWLPSLLPGRDDWQTLLDSLGKLYVRGAAIDWAGFDRGYQRAKVALPTYPFQRRRYWRDRASQRTFASNNGDSTGRTLVVRAEPAISCLRRPRDLSTPYVAPRTPLEADIAESWGTVLRVDAVGVYDNFFELGGDSLQATMLLNRLRERLGEALSGQVMLQLQSVNDLANYLRRQCTQAVQRHYPDEPLADTVEARHQAASQPAPNGSGKCRPECAPGQHVSIPALARDEQAADLLAHLDELSEDEVEALLGQAVAEGEAQP